MSKGCPFCAFRSRRFPQSRIVFETDETVAFLSNRPVSRGHTLVIPKVHYSSFLETPPAVLAAMMISAHRAAQLVAKAIHCPGLTIGINQGRASAQTVFHVHLHIMPRFFDDDLPQWESCAMPTASLAKLAKRMRASNKDDASIVMRMFE